MRIEPANSVPHYHGGVLHDHPGGDAPHDHPDPNERPGRGLAADLGFAAVLGCGIFGVIIGVLGVLLESNNHSACSSGLVQAVAQAQCQTDNLIWTGGLIVLALSVVVLIGAVIVRWRRPS